MREIYSATDFGVKGNVDAIFDAYTVMKKASQVVNADSRPSLG